MGLKGVCDTFLSPLRWQRMSLANIAGAGIFCADRAIHDYAREIWHLD